MQSTFRLKASELPDLITVLKTLFKTEKVIEITVKPSREKSVEAESKKEYWDELKRRMKNLEEGKNTVSFTEDEFDKFSNELIERYKK